MKMINILFLGSIFGLISCSNESTDIDEMVVDIPPDLNKLYFPPIDSNDWETLSIQDLEWNQDQEQQLYNFLEDNDTKAFIILKSGRIVVEKYFNGASASDNNPWYSAGKTLTAFTTGIAQQEGLLDINQSSSTYLGTEWASISNTQEATITVRNHLTMSTGLDYNVSNQNCTDMDCLTYLNTPGTFWYYHNAAYTLLADIITNASNQTYTNYFNHKLRDPIGMNGTWISLGYANVYYSNARSMARFGLLNLNKGSWGTTKILEDEEYFNQMTTTSQNMNASYGYLWWLNGKSSFRAPAFEIEFAGELIPEAPQDLIAGLGKNDQKLYVVPSQNLVVIRMGDDTGESLLGPSSFDNELWKRINLLIN
ncbi:serine hydrolase [Aquimarina sp. AU474]|uniref:serine hydrolase domain-containing protein n=1 Tax=Aquimarina sp. AU474 TaxID=2108529 RepID=UPI000D686848|nr:serine hydrolase domain-containing protein [Aquimarina sp. AU474]